MSDSTGSCSLEEEDAQGIAQTPKTCKNGASQSMYLLSIAKFYILIRGKLSFVECLDKYIGFCKYNHMNILLDIHVIYLLLDFIFQIIVFNPIILRLQHTM